MNTMLKKITSALLSICMIIPLCATAVSAEELRKIDVTEENYNVVLDPYVKINNQGAFQLSLPSNIRLNISDEVQDIVNDSINIANTEIDTGNYIVTSDGEMLDKYGISTFHSGYGVDKIVGYWWGKAKYCCNSCGASFARDLGNVSAGATGAGFAFALASIISPILGGGMVIGAGVTAFTVDLVVNEMNYKLANTNSGIIVNLKWSIIGTMVYYQ